MELKGMKRSIQTFEVNGFIDDLTVTDCHTYIKASAAKEGTSNTTMTAGTIGKYEFHETVECMSVFKFFLLYSLQH